MYCIVMNNTDLLDCLPVILGTVRKAGVRTKTPRDLCELIN